MRRLADQCQAAGDIALGLHQRQRVGPARPDRLDGAEKIAEPRPQLGGEFRLGQRQEPRRQRGVLGPDNRGAVAGHRQYRERAGRQEMLNRDAAMRVLVRHGRDDAGLLVTPLDGADPGRLAQWRVLAVGRDDEAGAQPRAVGEHDRGAGLARLHCGDALRRQQPEARQRRGAPQQRAAQYPVLDDVAERRVVVSPWGQLAVVVMQEQGRIVVGDADLADRFGIAGDLRPQPDAVEHQPRPIGDRRAAAVETSGGHRRRVLAIDNDRGKPSAAAGDREHHAVEPAARDHQLGIIGHG